MSEMRDECLAILAAAYGSNRSGPFRYAAEKALAEVNAVCANGDLGYLHQLLTPPNAEPKVVAADSKSARLSGVTPIDEILQREWKK